MVESKQDNKDFKTMDEVYYFTQLGAKGEVAEYVAKGYKRFEDLPESERLWLMDLFSQELPSSEYEFLFNDAIGNGGLTSYVISALKQPEKVEELMQKMRELMEDCLGWQIDELFEAEISNRRNNPHEYWEDAA